MCYLLSLCNNIHVDLYKTFRNMIISKIIRLHMQKKYIHQRCRQNEINDVYDVMLKMHFYSVIQTGHNKFP